MANNIDYDAPHKCPVYDQGIDPDLCYETLMALKKMVKISSVPELEKVKDIEAARQQCRECPYSKL